MSNFKRILPYLIITLVSVAIIVASIFVVPAMFNQGGQAGGPGGDKPVTDQGDPDFINSLGGVSDTFAGAISEYTYSSVEDAARAYVENELASDSNVTSVTTASVQQFSPNNVDIAIPAEFLNNADSVEKLSVTYCLESASTYSAMSTSIEGAAEYVIYLYLIQYGPDYRYFTPMPITGETINKAYYDSVFNSDRYANCTLHSKLEESAVADIVSYGEKMTMTMNLTVEQTIMYEENKIYLYQKMDSVVQMTYAGETETDESSQEIYAYIEEDKYGYPVCYTKDNETGAWEQVSLSSVGFSSIEELRPFYEDYLDHSYFSKTNYGFALEDENAKQYFMQAFDQLAGNVSGVDFGSDGVEMTARYYIQEGALTGVQSDAAIDASVELDDESADMHIVVHSVTTCYDYGTTQINIDINQ